MRGGLVAKSCPILATPCTVSSQAPLSMGFSRQEYWSGLPFPSPEDLPTPGIKPWSPTWQADSLLSYEGSPGGGNSVCVESSYFAHLDQLLGVQANIVIQTHQHHL